MIWNEKYECMSREALKEVQLRRLKAIFILIIILMIYLALRIFVYEKILYLDTLGNLAVILMVAIFLYDLFHPEIMQLKRKLKNKAKEAGRGK